MGSAAGRQAYRSCVKETIVALKIVKKKKQRRTAKTKATISTVPMNLSRQKKGFMLKRTLDFPWQNRFLLDLKRRCAACRFYEGGWCVWAECELKNWICQLDDKLQLCIYIYIYRYIYIYI